MNALDRIRPKSLVFCFLSISFLSFSACSAAPEPTAIRWSEPQFAGIPDASVLNELSGLAHSTRHPSVYWAINDSDNESDIIAIDEKARTKSIIHTHGVSNLDWEDITSYELNGKHYIAIADTGDNGGIRKQSFIYIFEEPETLQAELTLKPIQSITFTWPDGPHDTEALFFSVKQKSFYLISKKRVPALVFQIPLVTQSPVVAKLVARLNAIPQPDAKTLANKGDFGRYRSQITGASLSPDESIFAVLNYQRVHFFNFSDISRGELTPVSHLDLPWLPQAEGISFSQDGNSIFVSGEQSPAPLIRFNQLKP